ncbi:rhamnogalacturonan lyase [Pelobium manganitolerans]|uniref:rhamnogalacturonan lyase n=1 Tax=Pelobium manganitolerans TaxID=1842495 RepID=UPI003FA35F85
MKRVTIVFILAAFSTLAFAQRQMENLDRGIVAVRQAADSVFVSWRILGTEDPNIAFNIYRNTGAIKNKLNAKPLTGPTFFVDTQADSTKDHVYEVKAIVSGKEVASKGSFLLKANTPVQQYLNIPLKTPQGYRPGDASVGDLDGDGQYDIVLHQTGRGRDNSFTGLTDPPIFQAYKIDGTMLWEINLGKNIREGAHYTQFMVYDLDGDGIAEFACKTADGTVDGKGKVIGDPNADWRDTIPTSRTFGKIMTGPEYFTIFNGKTGEAMATADYIPSRGNMAGWGGHGGNGGTDNSGNRVDRFLACIAYLDGERPSVVMCRGYYGRTVLAAWDWRGGKLSSRWVFDTKDGENPFSGMGNHNLSVADVDGDGKDEIIYGSMCVDDDGTGLYSTGFRHGDALHVGDLDPDRPGLEVFGIHEIEDNTKGPGVVVYDAKTGKTLVRMEEDNDIGRGVAENIDPNYKGAYMWWGRNLYNMKGELVGPAPRSGNFLIWWDGDLSRELLNANYIEKYQKGRIFTATGASFAVGSKATPVVSADLFGDWREELVLRSEDNQSLRIYTTTIPTEHRNYTLMHDPQYRLSIAWQNVGYNMPPHTGFYFGTGMQKAPKPNIKLISAP